MYRRWLATLLLLQVSSFGAAQAPTAVPPKSDYSQEAAIIEDMSSQIVFDNDGGSQRAQTTRIRVQTDGGVQQWGLLNFPFQSATQAVEIDYVRVRKPDGTVLTTPSDNIQDLDAEITRSAPFYSDLREKHVAVKGLGKGDILEYQAHWRSTKSLIPGQFWYQYNFHHEGIVLAERLEIKVPASRAVKVKGPQDAQTLRTEPGYQVYSWTFSRLKSATEPGSELKKQVQAVLGRLPAPDVQISSFQSWDEVGRWYWNLQKDRVEPTPAIRAKAAELTRGMSDDAAKMRALYNFVSLQFRYIGIAFGIGRYQPHSADDVLTNNYGDCKDKHTLLASLMQAAGITLYPALIASSWKLDPDVPSPAQFDHIIGYLPADKNASRKDAIWLDTTPEVSPFGLLVLPLRDKQALTMFADKPAQLITTPADLSAPGSIAFKISGKLSDDGTFDAKVEDSMQGDREIPLRSAFRRFPQSQWKDLVQGISQALGFAGTVSEVSAGTPELTSVPFHFSYTYNRKDYPDWSRNHQFTVPGLPFSMPQFKEDATDPLYLGSPEEIVSDATVETPKGYKLQPPPNLSLKYDFAEYHATYSQDHNILTAKRRLLIKLHEVPVAESSDYRSFVKSIQEDVYRYVQTSGLTAPDGGNPPPSGTLSDVLNGIWKLPESDSSEANRLEASARNQFSAKDPWSAINTYRQVVEADPEFTRAWLGLATAYMATNQIDSALEAFSKAVDSDPKQLLARKSYALALTGYHRPEAAMDAWRALLEIAPDDIDANLGMGTSLMQQKRYSDSLPYLENAAKNNNSIALNSLGFSYLKAGESEKGIAALAKILETDTRSETYNDVAYELAENNAGLSKALEFAERAVNEEEEKSYDFDLSDLAAADLDCVRRIESFWDTLGWVYFRLGDLDEAESYLRAAWSLSQSAVVGDHLAQVYEKEKKTEQAIHQYHLVLATPETHSANDTWDDTRRRLALLTGAKTSTGRAALFDPSPSELSQLRTIKLKRLVPGSASAEFFLLFGPGPKLVDVKFISGSEKLKSVKQSLSEATFKVPFPQDSSAQLVRRVMVVCSPVTGCQAVLLLADTVKSVK